jgi:hypothetical protein
LRRDAATLTQRDATLSGVTYYMVPSGFLQVDYFPMNNSGKIDRNQLQGFYLVEKKKKR